MKYPCLHLLTFYPGLIRKVKRTSAPNVALTSGDSTFSLSNPKAIRSVPQPLPTLPLGKPGSRASSVHVVVALLISLPLTGMVPTLSNLFRTSRITIIPLVALSGSPSMPARTSAVATSNALVARFPLSCELRATSWRVPVMSVPTSTSVSVLYFCSFCQRTHHFCRCPSRHEQRPVY